MKDIAQLLSKYKLSLTQHRINIISVLINAEKPIGEKEIALELETVCDKSTIYRNLNTLTEKGVLQRIFSVDSIKYKLKNLNNDKKIQDHIHFKCVKCNKLICMEDLLVKDYSLPNGYTKTENQFLILGYCKDCNNE